MFKYQNVKMDNITILKKRQKRRTKEEGRGEREDVEGR